MNGSYCLTEIQVRRVIVDGVPTEDLLTFRAPEKKGFEQCKRGIMYSEEWRDIDLDP